MANLKLTEKSIAALAPSTTHARSCPGGECACPLQSYYWDTELVGFGVVVGRTGIKTFIARAWVGTKRRRVKIGVAGAPRTDGHRWTVALARVEARQLLGRMSAGEDPNAGKRATSAPPPGAGPTLRQAMELHVTNMRAGRNRRRRVCAPRSIQKIETEIPRPGRCLSHVGTEGYVILGEHGSLYLVDGTGGNIVTSRELDTYPVWAYEPQVAVLTGDRIAIPRRGSEIGAVAVSVLSVLEDSFLLTGDLQVPVCATL
jgi:hypothetical protein